MNNHNTRSSKTSGYEPRHAHEPEWDLPADQEAAFAAFCTLSDVDPNVDVSALGEQFEDCYAGTWTDETTMINELTHVNVIEAAIAELQSDGINTSRFVEVDYAALDELMRERWSFVYNDGTIHAFEK